MEDKIREFALENAVKFKGKANQGAVIGKLMSLDASVKSKMGELGPVISKIVSDVNSMTPEDQETALLDIDPSYGQPKEKVKKQILKDLKNAEQGKVVMRLEPSPSGPLHIGHAYVGSLNASYCKRYEGKMIVRISDTNANNIYEPAYKQIPEDAKWLWGNVDIVVQSDRLEIYYQYAEKLFKSGHMYVCECEPEKFKELITDKQACPCRELLPEEQLARWNKMLDGTYKEGDAVVRFKTSVEDKNPAMRDFPLLRINESEHPKQGTKYKVWPLMNFAVAIDDLTLGVTHSIRGKDHADNEKRQKFIFEALSSNAPEALFVGRINFEGFDVSCSKTKVKIQEGEFEGWDDPRIPFIPALKRRGYQPEAFMKYAEDVGVSLTDKTVHIKDFFKSIDAFDTGIVDKIAKRYFLIKNPVEVNIKNAPTKEVELDLHPTEKLGTRKFKVNESYLLEKEDVDSFEPKEIIRLIDNLNFVHDEGHHSDDYADFKGNGTKLIHFLPNDKEQIVDVEVRMPDNSVIKGVAEKNIETLNVGDVIQFQRFGFCRLDEKGDVYKFWYSHN